MFKSFLKEFGTDIYINEETQTRQAIVSDQSVSDGYHDIVVKSNFQFNIGDFITYQGNKYLTVSDVQYNNGMYKGLARMLSAYDVTLQTQEEIRENVEYNDMGEPISWDVVQEAEYTDFPCIIETKMVDYDTGSVIALPNNQYLLTVQYHIKYEQGITVNLFDHDYSVKGVDRSKLIRQDGNLKGVLFLHLEW